MHRYLFRVPGRGASSPANAFVLKLSRALPGLHLKHVEHQGAQATHRLFVIAAPASIDMAMIREAMINLIEQTPNFATLADVPDTLSPYRN